ncbi:sigma-70, region 4 [Clostridiales bacterium oral taxon 876 str. F0540]|nr:sigma-70, region 4 [Clostridiales bacterium oral taxon 876 str. F0540]
MKREEVINLSEEWLKSVPDLKKRIRLIDVALKKDSYDKGMIEKLQHEKDKLNKKLSRIIKAIGTLEEENQKIICYRYFEGLTYKEIALRVHAGERTVYRRIQNKLLLQVGRIMFGFEDEFWRIFIED